MSNNKFTAMMREQERKNNYFLVSTGNSERRKELSVKASDWRAMRETWEAMVVALDSSTAVLTQPNVGCYAQAAVNDAALAKARDE